MHIPYPPRKLDHVIERVHADRRERAARRFFRCGAPVVRRDELPGTGRVLRHYRDHSAEPAVLEMLAHVADGRMKAPAATDGPHYAGAFRCRDCRLRAREVERDRLL